MRGVVTATIAAVAAAVTEAPGPAQDFEYLPGARYAAGVPKPRSVLGFGIGERISSHAETERYLRELAEASPLVELRRYGESWEGRSLHYLIVSAEKHLARLGEIRSGMQQLADPRTVDAATAARLVDELPAVTWLAYAVHGDEISGTDAAMQLAYHLAAAQDDELVATILDQSVVLIDPLQNPDGRERFVHHYRSTRGRWPDAEPDAAEHDQPWPGGRTNHYLFDMNRDWFALTQPETRGRVATFLEWRPVVYVDLHEMGSNSTYYFAPPAKPVNPEITALQREWLDRYGQNNARWFDRFGFDYFVREAFDAFYPGYGEGWPMFQGAIGMTYEQASVRGLVVRRDDETEMRYHESVQRHFIASLATAETAARNRRAVISAFFDYRKNAIEAGRAGPVREFVLPPGRDRHRIAKLAGLLTRQGIEVHRASSTLTYDRVRVPGGVEPRTFPAGTVVVRLDQPAKHLATTLLTRHQDMEPEFLAEQKHKYERRRSTEFYDLTGWSLPLLFGVECLETESTSSGELERLATERTEPGGGGGPAIDPDAYPGTPRAKIAYVIPAGSNHTGRALAELLRRRVRVFCADEPFRIGERSFDRGSLLVKVHDNEDSVHAVVWALDRALGLDVLVADSSWVDEGISFGSNKMRYLKAPRVMLAWDRPASAYSAGWARYVLEQSYGYPVTIVRTRRLGEAELRRFDVLILPDGSDFDKQIDEKANKRLDAWIHEGGTLVTLGGSTKWLTGESVGLLAARAEHRRTKDSRQPEEHAEPPPPSDAGPDDPKERSDPKERGDPIGAEPPHDDAKEPYDYDSAVLPEDERPARTPGAILRVDLDPEHWLAFGCGASVAVVSMGRDIYTPIKLDKGTNVGVFAERERLLESGFAWDDKLDQLAKKPWLVHQPHGEGHVVAFAEDPNFRAFNDATDLLFVNAVLLGPGH